MDKPDDALLPFDRRMREFALILYGNSLTIVTCFLALVVLFGVDQVSHVAFHLPTIELRSLTSYDGFLVISFWIFVIVLLSIYVLSIARIPPPITDGWLHRTCGFCQSWSVVAAVVAPAVCIPLAASGATSIDSNLLWGIGLGLPIAGLLANTTRSFGARILDLPCTALGSPTKAFPIKGTKFAVVLFLALTSAFVYLIRFHVDVWQAGTGFLGIAIGACFLFLIGAIHSACYPVKPERTWVLMRPLCRGLFVLLLTNLVGETLWLLAHWIPNLVSFRIYSIWSIFQLLFIVVLMARLLDWLATETKWPMRTLGVATTALVLYCVSVPAYVGSPAEGRSVGRDPTIESKERMLNWLESFASRIERCPEDRPVLIVAASGGGSRAALFAALVYESLSIARFESKKGSRSWADQVVMISGVSGGSLASAYFGSQEFPLTADRPSREWQHSNTSEIQKWLPKKAKQFREKLESQLEGATEDVGETLRLDIEEWKGIEEISKKLAESSRNGHAPASDESAWLLKDAFADDMCIDFMAPLLRGVMYPGMERGVSVTDFWKRFQGFDKTNRQPWAEGRPLLLFNATQVEDGRRLVIGFPPIPDGFLARGQAMVRFLNKLNLDPSLRKNHPLCLGDHDPTYTLSMAEAVRLSANFPWGFNPGLLKCSNPSADSPYLKVVDGGVVDNTGFDSIASVLLALFQSVTDEDEAIRKLSERTINALKSRGVLILEIDSGANPGRPGLVAKTLNHVFDPVEGLEKSGFVNAQNSKLTYLRQFQEVLRQEIEASAVGKKGGGKERQTIAEIVPLCNFFQYHCNHSEDVMTAWSIGPDDKAAVLVQFLFEQKKKQDDLDKTLDYLSKCAKLAQSVHRNDKQDPGRVARAFQEFKREKAIFEEEQAVMSFAASNAKQALQGVKPSDKSIVFGQTLDKNTGVIDEVPHPDRATPIDSGSIGRVIKQRMGKLAETKNRGKGVP